MNATATVVLSAERRERLRAFVSNWIRSTSPLAVLAVELVGENFIAHDSVGSYLAGTVADWLPVARALGALRAVAE